MRLRFNKNAKSFLESNEEYFLKTTDKQKLSLNKIFSTVNPVYVEIGCGKGNFIIEQAKRNPDINFIGFEKNETILMKVLNKLNNIKLKNLKFICNDANNLNELFVDHSISKIYLNFSDPWPKKRHAKRRLTNELFLAKYQKLLVNNNSIIEFKTDNDSLFEYTYEEVLKQNIDKYNIIYYTKDLYKEINNKYNIDNIATEYEIKFHKLGKNIYKIIFNFK